MHYFSNSTQAFYNTEIYPIDKMPEDALEISDSLLQDALEKLNTGNLVRYLDGVITSTPKAETEQSERSWRNYELQRVDLELYKVQDSDPKAFGSVAEWRTYRKELRAWPESPYFPKSSYRPKSPDYKE